VRRLVFPNQSGGYLSHQVFLSKIWQPLLITATLPYRKIHALRHSFGTWTRESGEPIERVRDWLRHSTTAQTERYGHLESAKPTAALDALGWAMGSAPAVVRGLSPVEVRRR
jgi:integrase